MTRLRVNLDSDGFLSNFVDGWLTVANKVREEHCWDREPFKLEEVTKFNMAENFALKPEEKAIINSALASTPRFAYHLKPYESARAGVYELKKIADVRIVTTPWDSHPTWEFDRKQWLRRHFGIAPEHVTFTHEKWAVRGDVFVDDRADTVIEWEKHNSGLAVHWETPHNAFERYDGFRTCSWDLLVHWVRVRTAA